MLARMMFLTSVWGKCAPAELVENDIVRVYNIETDVTVDYLEAHLLKYCRNYEIIAVIPPSPWSEPSLSCYKLIIGGSASDFIRHHKHLPEMPNSFLIEGKSYDIEYHFPQSFMHHDYYNQYDTKQNNRPPGWRNNVPLVDMPQCLKQKYCINVTNKPPQWDSVELKNTIEAHFVNKGIWIHIYTVQSSSSYPSSAVIVCTTLRTKALLLDYNPLFIDPRVSLELKSF